MDTTDIKAALGILIIDDTMGVFSIDTRSAENVGADGWRRDMDRVLASAGALVNRQADQVVVELENDEGQNVTIPDVIQALEDDGFCVELLNGQVA